ncbi:MAG: hypothetical protein AABX73_03890 [Nanoarchaeota archaeon]
MKKEALVLFLALVILIPSVLADPIDEIIKKVTYQSEQFEAGNINYAQLIVYTTSLRLDLTKEMGATSQEHDPVLKLEQLEKALGKPTETTKWVWVETGDGGGYEKKLDNEAPAWRKPVFDGKKIQMWLSAWPNIIEKSNEDVLFYRLHLEIKFKSPEEQLNIKEKIEEIKSLSEEYSKAQNEESLETLARESVGVEQTFNKYFNQNPAKCEELMNDILGSENKRENQNLLVWEIEFYEGENFEAIMRFEMCDDCNWNWISPNMRIEGRGPGFKQPEDSGDFNWKSKERFSGFTSESFKQETRRLIDEIKNQIEAGDYQSAMEKSQELRIITESWNEKSNDVWKELEQKYQDYWKTMPEEEQRKCQETYCWIKKEQERREEESRLRKANYEERKNFYSELFAGYEKKEFYYAQEQWEKRLIQEFKEFGEEICSNNIDDNENEQIDCSDQQCGGKVCGYETVSIAGEDNQTREEKIELYCIEGTCQAKEEIAKEKFAVCGNHICEENEQEVCLEDCTVCSQHEPLQCSGDVIFSGKDKNGCPLEPICLSEDLSCETDNDCVDPLCGEASCIEGICQIAQLTECREAECADGERKIEHCSSGEEVIVEGCINGLWGETGVECEEGIIGIETEAETKETESVGEACSVRGDCGNENDVCSNGRCVAIPESIEEHEEIEEAPGEELGREEEIPEQEEPEIETEETGEESNEETEQTPEITGNIIFSFFRTLAGKMRITGFSVEEGSNSSKEVIDSGESSSNEAVQASPEVEINNEQNENPEESPRKDFEENRDDEREENRDREGEERERRENECSERCGRECYDREVRPCVEDCIREDCGEELECNVDDVRVSCEAKCKEENTLESCKNECSEKCLKGEDTWVEPEREEHKEEKFVFTVGGSCREAQGKTEGFIWFGGWTGDRNNEFNNFHLIKNKYYSHGGEEWCKKDLEDLLKQRKELENSLNEEFAKWFFEKYVSNSAEKWEEHISGIFEIYWRDVDVSKQITERLDCLNKDSLPPHKLINFKYETDYGSVEFWEEIKTTNQFGGGEKEIISPYMKTWLFPSREFFKFKMKESMENHELPGPPEEEKRNTISDEEKQELRGDEEFMRAVREFNEKYGENFVLQLKDFETNEVIFNVYMKINEDDLMYAEPMPPAENPAENVKAELDVEKLLEIVEFEESGRIELQSPPWDKKRETGFVKGAVDGARMYFMFRSLMSSIISTPEDAESYAKFFTREFFDRVMGDGKHEEGFKGEEGPGGCQSEEECKEYCENPENGDECKQFRDDSELPESWEDKGSLTGEIIRE